MKSGGQTRVTDIGVGRQLLCREKPGTRIQSKCAKRLKTTVTAAKKGLTPAQQKLWQQLVFTPAVLNAERFSKTAQRIVRCGPWDISCLKRRGAMTKAKLFKLNVKDVLAGKLKFKGPFGKKFKWSDYLTSGAKIIMMISTKTPTKLTDIGVGRHLLCKEKPGTPATSACAKKLKSTVTAAKKDLTAQQQKLWRKYVYTLALLQARRFCDGNSKRVPLRARVPGGEGRDAPSLTTAQKYKKCVAEVLLGTQKVKGLFKTTFKWSDYLINGAKIIKKLYPKFDWGSGTPGGR